MFNRSYRVAFEGLHRSGKGTQIELLRGQLSNINLESCVVRGAGSRLGQGINDLGYYDPFDIFWVNFSKDREYGLADWVSGAYKINSELFVLERTLSVDILLMDRCYVSNNFLLSLNAREPIVSNQFIPDIIYYLDVSKDNLISRINVNECTKDSFRLDNINSNYESYCDYIRKENVVVVDGNRDIVDIHMEIKKDLWKRLKITTEGQL